MLEELRIPAANEFADLDLPPLDFKPHIAPQKFEEMVETARDLIRNGDMFQCVLSQRFSAEVTGNPFDFYRNLRVTNPSNYLYFYDFGDYQIIGASPESLVSVKNGIVTTNPIAGTRPRGATDEEDKALATDLLSDEKETAEHRMLVDLGRNDIGRISETASVQSHQVYGSGALPLCYAFDQRGQGAFASRTHCHGCFESNTSCWNSVRSTKDSGHETHL